jgi:uncharacterized protein YgiM (DUF1202 family)
MKLNCLLALGTLLGASLTAQTNSSTPAAKPAPKPAAAQPALVEPAVSLKPGPATVNGTRVNMRGRSTILSEVLGQFNTGDAVTVLEQVSNQWAKGRDPKQWARIALPKGAPCWVFAAYVDASHTVTASRLNVRGGAGENFSILGRLPKGTTVKPITTKGEWMQIEAPEVATAYVAAMYLKQEAPAIASVEPPKPTPVLEPASTNVITDVESVVAPPVEVAAVNPPTTPPAVEPPAAEPAVGDTETEEPLKPRVVMREGIVYNATSIQAPSHYSLLGLDTRRTINYLYTDATNLNLNRWNGLHVIVTGEESLDERWPNTPILTLQRIQVVDDEK